MATTLTQEGRTRIQPSGWRLSDRRAGIRKNRSRINVGENERLASALAGGALAIYGLTRETPAGWALAALGGALIYRGATGHCVCYQTLGISTAEKRGPATSVAAGHGVKVETAITINKSPSELYQFWRNLKNLPRVMRHLKSVQVTDERRSHWVAKAPLGASVEWDAEIYNEKPDALIAWRSLEGSQVDTAGSVHFGQAPSGQGTEVQISMKYDPPGGKWAADFAALFGEDAEQEIKEDLRCFKQLMETGEIVSTHGQPR